MEMGRPLGTYNQSYWLMYLLAAGAMGLFVAGLLARIRRWRQGQGVLGRSSGPPLAALARPGARSGEPAPFPRRGQPWLFHFVFVWGFGLFLLATVCLLLQEHFALPTFRGAWYLGLSLAIDLFSVFFLLAAGAAAWRRWVIRPIDLERQSGDVGILCLLVLLPLTGLILEGVRVARTPDPWGAWAPVGDWIGGWFAGFGPATLDSLHQGLWWGHLLIALGFLAAIPYTRLFHLVSGPLSLFFADRNAARALMPLDFADETVGTLRRRPSRRPALEAAARCRRLHRLWPLPECLSGLAIGQVPVAEANVPGSRRAAGREKGARGAAARYSPDRGRRSNRSRGALGLHHLPRLRNDLSDGH